MAISSGREINQDQSLTSTGILNRFRHKSKPVEQKALPDAPIAPGMTRADVATDYLPGTMTEPKKRGLKLFSKETDPAEATEAYKKGLAEVYPQMEYFWLSHGKRVLELAGKPATEHHYRPGGDRFFQYQIVQQFVGATGQIDVAKIRDYFQKNRDAYDKTMLYIDRESALVRSAQGLESIVIANENIVASILDKENLQEVDGDRGQIIKGALEIATVAGVGAGAGTIRFWSQITALVEAGSKYAHIASLIETHAPMLYPFVVNPSLALGPILGGTVVFLTMKGVVDIWSGLNEGGKTELLRTSKHAYQAMVNDQSMSAYMKDMYAFSPSDIRINAVGSRKFAEREVSSPGWSGAKSFLMESMALRSTYYAKVLGVSGGQTEGEAQLKNGSLAEQSNAIFSRDVYAAFDAICKENSRSLVNIPEAIRIKYMLEAQKRVIQEWADKKFESVLEAREEVQVTSKKLIIENTQTQLREGGRLRNVLQKEARENRESAEDLLQGERKGNPPSRSGGLAKEAAVYMQAEGADATASSQAPINKDLSLDAMFSRYATEATSLEDVWDNYKDITAHFCSIKRIKSIPTSLDSNESIDVFIASLQWYSSDTSGQWISLTNAEVAPVEALIATQSGRRAAELAKKNSADKGVIGQLDTEIASLTTKIAAIRERYRLAKEKVEQVLASVLTAKRNRTKIEQLLGRSGEKHELVAKMTDSYKVDYLALTNNGDDALHTLFANYPAVGSGLADLLHNIVARGIWVAADIQVYANRIRVMRAVAYAKSKSKYNELIGTAAGARLVEHVDPPAVNTLRGLVHSHFTQEQIILLGPTELFKRLSQPNPQIETSNAAIQAADAAGNIGEFDALLANEQMRHIADCVEDERKRYEATQYGLTALTRQQELIVEGAKNTEQNIVKDCDKRVRMLEAAKGVLVDRANVYKKIPDLLTAESVGRLLTSADATTASTAGWVEIDRYLEKERNIPVVVLELMRAVFSYDTNVPPNGQTQDEVFADILEAMNKAGGNAATGYETVVKKAILMGIPDFANYLTLAADLNTLTLADMLIILRHRISGDGVQHRDGTRPVNRRLVPARPLSSIELKGILRSIIDTVAMPALSGHL